MRKIIDSHIHFWNPSHLRYEWLDSAPAINRPFLPVDLPKSGEGWEMEGLVFVEAGGATEQSVAEAEWITELAQDDDRIRAIVAHAAVENGEAEKARLDKLADIPLVKGIRRLTQSEPLGFGVQPDFIKGVQALADYDFSFDICIKHPQMGDVIGLVKQCPNISFVLDHIGKPDIANGLLDPWREQLKTLAGFDNVQCKLSGMVTEADLDKWTPDDLQPYVYHVLECFGTDRVMFGGDWPVVRLAKKAKYPRWVHTALETVIGLSDDEKDKLFYENAKAFYRL